MIARKYFGTDGIRGRFGDEVINPQFLLKLGWAAGKVLGETANGKILIGKDTRVSGYIIESVLEAGLASAGVGVRLLGPIPTPAIAYLTRTLRASAGIVISASHNPFFDNGIKFFDANGRKLPDESELAIEEQLEKPMHLVDASRLGKVKRYVDAVGRYIEFCKSTFGELNSNLRGFKIVLDCANGATYQVAPRVFDELGAEVITINTNPDGFNINEECGSTSPIGLRKIVIAEQADLGIAFDGDGDRVIMVDHKGEIVDGDELIYIIAKHEFATGQLKGGVVGTIMSNYGLEQSLQKIGIDFKRVQVGDRYILEGLKQTGWQLGGEVSGHIVHFGITSSGDGIVAALQVLSAMRDSEKSLFELKQEMYKMPQTLVNIKIAKSVDIASNKKIQQAMDNANKKLKASGRVLIRASGTEPLIRVMVEGEDTSQVQIIAEELAAAVNSAVTGS
jgi:phosphoglucosamine mutase